MTNRRFSTENERRLYEVWGAMKARCANPRHGAYINYGGRGIFVCKDWAESFESFYGWASPLYTDGLTLDRVDNDGEYSPSNCRFTTRAVNAINRRRFRGSNTGVAGVVYVARKRKPAFLRALITVRGERIYLGQFDCIFEAAAARKSAENRLHGPLLMAGG
jgi:hypothetical protein